VDPIPELARKLLQRLAPGAGQGYGCALCMERASNGTTDPACRSGDKGGLSGQIEHGLLHVSSGCFTVGSR
jgi:hypothetical protein